MNDACQLLSQLVEPLWGIVFLPQLHLLSLIGSQYQLQSFTFQPILHIPGVCVVVSLILVVASVVHNWSRGYSQLAEEWCGYWSQHGESADCLFHYRNTDHLLVSLFLSLVVRLHISHVKLHLALLEQLCIMLVCKSPSVLIFGICRPQLAMCSPLRIATIATYYVGL